MDETKTPETVSILPDSQNAVKSEVSLEVSPAPNLSRSKGGKHTHIGKELRIELGALVSNWHALEGMSFRKIKVRLETERKTYLSVPSIIDIHNDFITDFKKAHVGKSDVQIGVYCARMEHIINQALSAYKKTIPEGGETGNVEILFKLAKLLDDHFDKLQSTGAIDKVKEQVEHSGVIELQNFVKEFWKRPGKPEKK